MQQTTPTPDMIKTITTLGNSYTTLAMARKVAFSAPFRRLLLTPCVLLTLKPFSFPYQANQPQNDHRLRNRKLNLFFGMLAFPYWSIGISAVNPAWV
jgi:hypothetical protein